MNVITRGVRNAFRNVTRTISVVLILGLSIGLSLAMLIAHQAIGNGIRDASGAVGTTISIQANSLYSNSAGRSITAVTTAQMNRVRSIAHVTNIDELLNDRLQSQGPPDLVDGNHGLASVSLEWPFTLLCSNHHCSGGDRDFIDTNDDMPSSNSFSSPISIVGTNDPTNASNISASWLTIKSGHVIDGNRDINEAMVSQVMANKNNLHIGSTFTAYGQALTVKAIFNSDTPDGNDYIIVSLPTEQRLSGFTGDVAAATATVDSLTNLSATTAAIQSALGSSANVTSNVVQANDALQPLQGVNNISLYSVIGAVVAGAIIILLTMVMIVRERKREIAVLKAIGFSTGRIMLQFMAEAFTFAMLGMIIGVVLGVIGGNPVTTALIKSSPGGSASKGAVSTVEASSLNSVQDIHAHTGYLVILDGLGAAIVIALVGSSVASYFISNIRPADALRSE